MLGATLKNVVAAAAAWPPWFLNPPLEIPKYEISAVPLL